MERVAFLIALLVMLVGVAGTFLPALPGIPLIWLAMLGYGFVEGFREVTWTFLAISMLVVILSQVAEYYARALGTQKFGGSKAGAWGAVVGSLIGLFFLPIGLLLGPFLGALVAELASGRRAEEAVRAGFGGMVGVLGSVVVNVILALVLVVAFVIQVVF